MPRETYEDFVRDAFINPIRSVLIVDDDYPTIDEILSAKEAENDNDQSSASRRGQKGWHVDAKRMRKVINNFRKADPPLLVDIHDGSNIKTDDESQVIRHLHQSDLLILDYQLDGTQSGDKAIDIARTLMRNNHFNLVVVHTNEKLPKVFDEMLLGLLGPCGLFSNEELDSEVDAFVGDVEVEFPNAQARLRSAIGIPQYLEAVRNPGPALRTMSKGLAPFAQFKALTEELGLEKAQPGQAFRWALGQFELAHANQLNDAHPHKLTWSSEHPRWIRCDTMFMTFTDKGQEADLSNELLKALTAWAPPPSRLFLARLRAELDDAGVAGESRAIDDKAALAYWYKLLLESKEHARRALLEDSIGRHAEQLVDYVGNNLLPYAEELLKLDSACEEAERASVASKRFEVDLTDGNVVRSAQRAHNVLVSSKRPQGWHLRTGHIFRMDDAYWVCMSPLCDMVPGQKRAGHRGEVGDKKPFIAVQLHPVTEAKLSERGDIQSNRYVFLKIEGKLESFCFNEVGDEGSQPHWYIFYAENQGVLNAADLSIRVSRLRLSDENLASEEREAVVVAQLRYEYAINLMQRLGTSLTRIGLDFSG